MKKLIFCVVLLLTGCAPSHEKSSAQKIVDASIEAYGGKAWEDLHLEFKFRKHNYHLYRKQNQFRYVRKALDSAAPYIDSLWSDGRFTRHQNQMLVQLSDSLKKVYSASVNSVLYFVQIPHILNDAAVIKTQLPDKSINGKTYHSIKVTFQQEGGGEDFQDEFRYWIDPKTYSIDYMAYNYLTDGGGTRFRVAYNQRTIGPIRVQDYRNLKPNATFTPLDSLPKLFESGKLQQLSVIENTHWEIY